MSPGTFVLSGIGHWISPTFQPGDKFHLISVGRPASPENFQYVCQPGAIRRRSPAVKGLPGTIAEVLAMSEALTNSLPWKVWPATECARKIAEAAIDRWRAKSILTITIERSPRQRRLARIMLRDMTCAVWSRS